MVDEVQVREAIKEISSSFQTESPPDWDKEMVLIVQIIINMSTMIKTILKHMMIFVIMITDTNIDNVIII